MGKQRVGLYSYPIYFSAESVFTLAEILSAESVFTACRDTFRQSLFLRLPIYFPAESVFTLAEILFGGGCFYSLPIYFSAEAVFTACRDTFRRQLFLRRDKERQPLLSVPRRAGKRELYADFHRFCLHRRDRELRQA